MNFYHLLFPIVFYAFPEYLNDGLLGAYSKVSFMREKLTAGTAARAVDEAIATGSPVFIWDASLPGFGIMATAAGHRSWLVQYKQGGVTRRRNLSGVLDLTTARKEAKTILGEAARGRDPIGEQRQKARQAQNTLEAVVREYFARDGKKLRTAERQKREWQRLVFPTLGSRQIGDIKRLEVVRLLDRIEDESGKRAADTTLTIMSRLFNWHAIRDEDFRSPLVRGMRRIGSGEGERDRILSDDELRAVWRAAEAYPAPLGAYIRFLLLTGVRRNEAARMTWAELSDGSPEHPGAHLTVPAARMKARPGKARDHVVPLTVQARVLLDDLPEFGPFVFTTNGRVPINGFAKFKRKLDAHILAELRKRDPGAEPLPHWTLHDLRRTARSLLSRAGVTPDVAERCVGHTMERMRGIYDRYKFYEEKRRAFEALAGLIERIVNPPAGNVLQLRGGG
jgi:integrase